MAAKGPAAKTGSGGSCPAGGLRGVLARGRRSTPKDNFYQKRTNDRLKKERAGNTDTQSRLNAAQQSKKNISPRYSKGEKVILQKRAQKRKTSKYV